MDPRLTGSVEHFRSERFVLASESFATDAGPVTRPVIHHPGAVAILAQPDADHVLLVRQFRYPVRRWTLEIPAGTRVPGEDPLATAHRELREETGLAAESMHELCRFHPALGVSDEEMILYRASGLRSEPLAPDHGELVAAAITPLAELPQLRRAGLLCDAKTLLACQLLCGGTFLVDG
jgi:ADP-ribose pyrophosphatase